MKFTKALLLLTMLVLPGRDVLAQDSATFPGIKALMTPAEYKAAGLDKLSPAELEEYYRTRNLLQARVTPRHVANAVLFFATRQTPTTGVTLPVDGGLPDATPR